MVSTPRSGFGLWVFVSMLLLPGWAGAQVTHVVHVSLDGLGSVYLQNYLSNGPTHLPNFVRLINEGAYTFNARCDYFASETIPNHASIFTGRPVLQPTGLPNTVHHGYADNGGGGTFHSFNPNVPYKASFMDVAHDHGLTTGFYASKIRLALCDFSYDENYGALDVIGEDNGRDKIDFAFINDGPIAPVIDQVVANLATASPRNYSFIHLREPDTTGHVMGWGSPAYSNAVVLVDREIGRIFSALDGNPILSSHTVLIVSADHGGGGEGPGSHSRPEFPVNYTIPFFVWGPIAPPAANLYTLFTNRRDPGTNRVEYHVIPQPIRNGDAGNLALAYLGLPSIPGSFMIPVLAGRTLLVQRERNASGAEIIKVSWRISGEQFLLQWTDSLQPPADWRSVDIFHLTQENGFFCYRVPAGSAALKFFRLRRM